MKRFLRLVLLVGIFMVVSRVVKAVGVKAFAGDVGTTAPLFFITESSRNNELYVGVILGAISTLIVGILGDMLRNHLQNKSTNATILNLMADDLVLLYTVCQLNISYYEEELNWIKDKKHHTKPPALYHLNSWTLVMQHMPAWLKKNEDMLELYYAIHFFVSSLNTSVQTIRPLFIMVPQFGVFQNSLNALAIQDVNLLDETKKLRMLIIKLTQDIAKIHIFKSDDIKEILKQEYDETIFTNEENDKEAV
jgi:hypothetical protein